MKISGGIGISVFALLLILMPLLIACSGDEQEKPAPSAEPTIEPAEDIILTIGVITDETGPAASAYIDMDMALADMVKHYNEEDIIPGIELKVITYDGQYDSSKDIPGYEWLKKTAQT